MAGNSSKNKCLFMVRVLFGLECEFEADVEAGVAERQNEVTANDVFPDSVVYNITIGLVTICIIHAYPVVTEGYGRHQGKLPFGEHRNGGREMAIDTECRRKPDGRSSQAFLPRTAEAAPIEIRLFVAIYIVV